MVQLLLDKLNKNDLLIGGKLLHMRCTAHILNLIVKKGLTVIGGGVANSHASVAFWTMMLVLHFGLSHLREGKHLQKLSVGVMF